MAFDGRPRGSSRVVALAGQLDQAADRNDQWQAAMTPAELLDAARDVLADTSAATAGWPRMVALLTRQALEEALSEFWEGRPATAGLSARTNPNKGD